MTMRKLIELMDKIAFANPEQKPGDYWKGTDKGTPGNKLVGGESVDADTKFLGKPYVREEEGEPDVDCILEHLSKAYNFIMRSEGYSTQFKECATRINDIIRRSLMRGDMTGFNDAWIAMAGRYPDEFDEYAGIAFESAGLGEQDTFEDFIQACSLQEADLTEELRKAFEDYVSNEKYDADKLYPAKNKRPSVDKKKPTAPKIVDPNVLGEETTTDESKSSTRAHSIISNKLADIARRNPEAVRQFMTKLDNVSKQLGDVKTNLGANKTVEEDNITPVAPVNPNQAQNQIQQATGTQPPSATVAPTNVQQANTGMPVPGAPQTTAQQAPAPKGLPTAPITAGQPTPPTAGQAGGAPVAQKPGTPTAPTGTAANAATTPTQTLATSVQQLSQPGNQVAAKKVADALARIR